MLVRRAYMFYVNLSSVHKFDKAFDVNELNILHNKDRIFFFVLGENRIEVGTACG